jgi:hypothetical protein
LFEDIKKGQFEIEGQALYNSAGRGQGRGCSRFGSTRTNNSYQGRGQQTIFRRNISMRGRDRQNNSKDHGYWYCGKPSHTQVECSIKQNEEKREKRQQNNFASMSESNEKYGAFVIQHEMTLMTENAQGY